MQIFGLSTLQHRLPSCYTLRVVITISAGGFVTVRFLRMRRDFHFNGLSVVGARGDRFLRRGGDDWFLRFGCIFYVLQFLSHFLI